MHKNKNRYEAVTQVMDHGRLVYVPDELYGYALGKLVDIGSDTLTIQIIGNSGTNNGGNTVSQLTCYFIR